MNEQLHLKDYDLLMNRATWEEALAALQSDLSRGSFLLDRDRIASELSLPSDWTWTEVRHFIAQSREPENAFTDLLAALYRAAPEGQIISPESYIRGPENTVYRRRQAPDNDGNPNLPRMK